MCELLGVPPADYDTFSAWTSDIGLVFGLAAGGDIPARVERAVAGLDGYVDDLIDETMRWRLSANTVFRRATGDFGFGGGPYYCLGAALAHVELEEALPILARIFGPPAVTATVTWRPAVGIHGPDDLPLRFTPTSLSGRRAVGEPDRGNAYPGTVRARRVRYDGT